MTPSQRCCFVLWGDQCDEAAAALFVTTLRAAGLRVWVVGISGKRIGGAHGLQLVADLAVDEALSRAAGAVCVVIPCTAAVLAHFLHDPRVRGLLETLQQQQVPLLLSTGNESRTEAAARLDITLVPERLTLYPTGELLLPFIEALAARLA